jgi:hypothetical protein
MHVQLIWASGVKVQMLIADWQYSSPDMWPYLDSLDVLQNVEVRVMVIPRMSSVLPAVFYLIGQRWSLSCHTRA